MLYAAQKGSLELCQFLVANKAEVNAKQGMIVQGWAGAGRCERDDALQA